MRPPANGIQYVDANGLRFAYIAEGEGPLVLLLHGFPDTARTWDHVRPLIAAMGYRAVSPFMRGYRPTQIPSRDADEETLAHDALALIAAFGERDAVLVGHDWGATTVYRAAAVAPDKVRKLIAVGVPHPAAVKPTPEQIWAFRHFFVYKLPGAARRFARNDFAASTPRSATIESCPSLRKPLGERRSASPPSSFQASTIPISAAPTMNAAGGCSKASPSLKRCREATSCIENIPRRSRKNC
jgi:pimeloyl-ACP methyl ester carboxylesterase